MRFGKGVKGKILVSKEYNSRNELRGNKNGRSNPVNAFSSSVDVGKFFASGFIYKL